MAQDSGKTAGSSALPEILERLSNRTQEQQDSQEKKDKISLGQLIQTFGSRSFGPMLLLPAAISLLPVVGGIPGVSMLTSAWIILIAAQILFRREHLWLPERLMKVTLPTDRVQTAIDKSTPWARRLDKLIRPRLTWLCAPPWSPVTAAVIICVAASMFPLEFIPYGVTPAALALTIFAVGITVNDGVTVLIGLGLSLFSFWFAWYMLV